MKKEDLNILLNKYYNGDSSEEEERLLKEFFQGDNVPVEFETEKEIFRIYSNEGDIPEPSAGFEDRIIAGIDDSEKNSKSSQLRRFIMYSLSTAAGLIIVAGSYFYLNSSREPVDTFSDPKIAYAETMKILLNVSTRLNEGNKVLEPLGKINKMKNASFASLNKSTRIIEKGLKTIEKLDKEAGLELESDNTEKNK
jgi:hypothetical protein